MTEQFLKESIQNNKILRNYRIDGYNCDKLIIWQFCTWILQKVSQLNLTRGRSARPPSPILAAALGPENVLTNLTRGRSARPPSPS